jgi:surface polysaccharide O-acyltransferase-like enzyme
MVKVVNKKEIFDTFAYLRFPLILGVVLIHNSFAEPALLLASNSFSMRVIYLISYGLSLPCVPLFFCISGTLFFRNNHEQFNWSDFIVKLRKRAKSLLIPYVFWNLVIMGLFILAHIVAPPTVINPEFNNVLQYSLIDFIRSFWDYPGGFPICFQLWFVRDLMLAVLLTPILFYVISRMGTLWVCILTAVFCYNPHLYFGEDCLTFFSIGAWLSIKDIDVMHYLKKMAIPLTLIWMMTLVLQNIGFNVEGLLRLAGAGVYLLVTWFITHKGWRMPSVLTESSFFIYCFHAFPLMIIGKGLYGIVGYSDGPVRLLWYIVTLIFILLISVGLYALLKRMCPKFCSVITGGR